jgi:hypothetical protein
MTHFISRTIKIFIALGATAATVLVPANAAATKAEPQIVNCRDVPANGAAKAQVTCDVTASDPISIKSVKVNGGTANANGSFKARSAAEPLNIVVVLIDKTLDKSSANPRAEFNRLNDVLKRLVDPAAKGLSFAAYAFDSEIYPIAPIGMPQEALMNAVSNVSPKELPGPSVGLRAVIDVLPKLSAAPGGRKAIVILSRGDFEPFAYPANEVVEKVKQAGVTIYGVIPANREVDRSVASTLERLARDTGGQLIAPDAVNFAVTAIQQLKSALVYGGTISFDPVSVDMKIEAEVEGGKLLTASYRTALPLTTSALDASNATSAPAADWRVLTARHEAALLWLNASLRNQLLAGGALAAFLLLVGGVIVALSRRAPKTHVIPGEPFVPAPGSVSAIKPVLGWLEFLDGNQTREPINSRATRVGRSTDNDIVLRNDSVHRQHAVIREDPAGGLIIVDMDTVNGVRVNGDRVKSAKLKQGDVIELGEVRMRFDQPHTH